MCSSSIAIRRPLRDRYLPWSRLVYPIAPRAAHGHRSRRHRPDLEAARLDPPVVCAASFEQNSADTVSHGLAATFLAKGSDEDAWSPLRRAKAGAICKSESQV